MKRQPTSFSRKRGLEAASSGRDGIALIAVLGFLSVLILMAVAFLMNMRTERLVAESSKDDVRTRQLVHSAVASAMDSVDGFMDSGALVRMPVNYAVFESTNGTTSLGTDVELISDQVTNWLPQHFRPGQQYDARWIEQHSAKWVLVQDGVHGEILGRYAFLAMDCTGMMDVNLVTNPATRGEGRTIAEVDSQFLPEVGNVASARMLFRSRTNYTLFGTFPEIVNLSGLTRPVNNLMPYSLCYDNGWWDGTQWQMTGIGGTPIDVRSWTEGDARTVFSTLYGPLSAYGYDPVLMSQCFADYVDTDDLPGGSSQPKWDTVSCEAFPMINEITASNRIYDSGGGYSTHEVVINVELWYPYAGVTNTKQYEVRFVGADWDFAAMPGAVGFNPTTLAPPQNVVNDPLQPFRVVSFVNSVRTTNHVGKMTLLNRRLMNVQIEVREGSGGPLVDRSVEQNGVDLRLPALSIGSGLPQNAMAATWVAVNDPRLNHLSAQWSRPPVNTMNAINENVDRFGSDVNGYPEGTNMFVRNSTNLLSAAELGFIPGGLLPWTTINLFTAEGMELLTKYRTYPLTARIYTNGFVNPNTLYTNVLKSIFRNVALNDYPEGASAMSVDDAMAGEIVGSVYANGTSTYESAAGWVTTEAFRSGGTLSGPLYANPPYNMNNTKKESIIRGSYKLFNPNQQLFTIVVVAQSINDHGDMGEFDGEDIDVVVGEKRAVALVWRDPFPGPSGRHEMFVKVFKYLDE